MCTVTFIARRQGYCLGMNRDEKLTRPAGLPPGKRKKNGHTLLCPSEPSGGTWVSVNDLGTTFALINWYSVAGRVKNKAVSRGKVVNSASAIGSPGLAQVVLTQLPLTQINPFRLIGIFPGTEEVVEWRWNLKKLVRKDHPWKTQQWISSGFDEPTAQRIRGKTFRKAMSQRSAGTASWLRRLHRSHSPEAGPFSICMHRADAATVSYTEITVARRQAKMLHNSTSPCNCSVPSIGSLNISPPVRDQKPRHGSTPPFIAETRGNGK